MYVGRNDVSVMNIYSFPLFPANLFRLENVLGLNGVVEERVSLTARHEVKLRRLLFIDKRLLLPALNVGDRLQ